MNENKHGGDIYSYMRLHQKRPVDFSANVNPLGLPSNVAEALRQNISEFAHYPDTRCLLLREKLAQYEKVRSDELVFGAGAADIIFRMVRSLRPRSALIPAPTFSEYEQALRSVDCGVDYLYLAEKSGFKIEANILERLNDQQLVFICNPNNPTGLCPERPLLYKILKRCREINCTVIVDECFIDFVADREQYSVYKYLAEFESLIILKAFTKNFAMAGLRLGYALSSNTELLAQIAAQGQPWSVSTPAQVAGIAALDNTKYLAQTLQNTIKERKYLTENLAHLPFKVYHSQANFILLKLLVNIDLAQALYDRGILIRKCSNFIGLDASYFRIAVKSHADNALLIHTLQEIFKEVQHG